MSNEPPIQGTVSHGTLRLEDLLPAFLDTLQALDAEQGAEHAPEVAGILHDLATADMYGRRTEADERALWAMEALDDAISAALPAGWHFGTTEGDGSDFGIWRSPCEECGNDFDDADGPMCQTCADWTVTA